MDNPTRGQSGSRPFRRGIVIAVSAVVLAMVSAGGWWLTAGDPVDDPAGGTTGSSAAPEDSAPVATRAATEPVSPSTSETSPPRHELAVAPTSAPTTEPPARQLIEGFVADTTAVLSGAAVPDDVAVADGTVRGALLADTEEFTARGWTLEGVPVVTSVEILEQDLISDPPTVTLAACLDSSEVWIKDGEGALVGSPEPARSLNIYTSTLVDGFWVLVDHSFPDDPDC